MVDAAEFKLAMRRMVAGVSIITTLTDDGHPHGLTATAVTTVTADPPTLLCCVNRSASAALHIRDSRRLGVNVLTAESTRISQHFSDTSRTCERFTEGSWISLATGAPILREALAAFDCRISQLTEVGSHFVILGAIEAIHLSPTESKPLLYGMTRYGTFEFA